MFVEIFFRQCLSDDLAQIFFFIGKMIILDIDSSVFERLRKPFCYAGFP